MDVDSVGAEVPVEVVFAVFEGGQEGDAARESPVVV